MQSTGTYIQSPGMEHDGEDCGKEHACVKLRRGAALRCAAGVGMAL